MKLLFTVLYIRCTVHRIPNDNLMRFSPRASRSISLKVVLIVIVLLVLVVVTNYKLSHIKVSTVQYQDGTFRTSNLLQPNEPILPVLVRNSKSGLERAVQNVSHSVSACLNKKANTVFVIQRLPVLTRTASGLSPWTLTGTCRELTGAWTGSSGSTGSTRPRTRIW